MMKLSEIQPSQLYICSEKLSEVMKTFDANNPTAMEPIPVKRLGDDVIFVDGHTRAFAAFLHGFSEVPVYWEDEELDWDAYRICVEWCKNEGIRTIADLKNRVVSQREYEKLWYERCEKMQKALEAKRKKKA
ncbi:MAG: ParB/Srx family N-terminal domain-containing protein [Candidatus Bathyarchaeia archaeon]